MHVCFLFLKGGDFIYKDCLKERVLKRVNSNLVSLIKSFCTALSEYQMSNLIAEFKNRIYHKRIFHTR